MHGYSAFGYLLHSGQNYLCYFIPAKNLAIVDETTALGKWANVTVDELMKLLAIEKKDCKKYYDEAEENFLKIYKYEENILKAAQDINGSAFDFTDS